MNYLRYWTKYVHKEEVKGEGIKNGNESTSHYVISIIIVFAPIECIGAKPHTSSLTRKANQLLASLTPFLLLKQNHFAKLCFQTCARGMAKSTLKDGAHPLPYAKTRY